MKTNMGNFFLIVALLACDTLTAYTIYKQCYKHTMKNHLKYKKCACDCFSQKKLDSGRCTRCWHNTITYEPKLVADKNTTSHMIAKKELHEKGEEKSN